MEPLTQTEPVEGSEEPRPALTLGVPLPCQVARLIQGRRYAFIRLPDGRQVFMPGSALRGLRFTELQPDQEVDCWLEIGCAGLQAARVQRRRKARRRSNPCSNRTSPHE